MTSRRSFLLSLAGAQAALGRAGQKQNPAEGKAIEHGLKFIYRTAKDPKTFSDYGDDLL
jgi:hypothetical protein